jgi:para-aminobenzoate synthetase component 1
MMTPAVRAVVHLGVERLLSALLVLAPSRRLSLLDSGGARPPDARYLIAGFDPFEVIEARGTQLRITRRGETVASIIKGDVLRILDERLEKYRVPHDYIAASTRLRVAASHQASSPHASMPVAGACIATFSYDMARRFERLRSTPASRSKSDEPDAVLAFYDTLVIHDYAESRTEIVSIAGHQRIAETCAALEESASSEAQSVSDIEASRNLQSATRFQTLEKTAPSHHATSNFTRDEYIAAARRIKEHIAAGDIYQANLTQQLSVKLTESLKPEHIFLRLRRNHPASFAAILRRGEETVISASPERFLRVDARIHARSVEAWPIKGTRARGRNAEEDAHARLELQMSEKDRAENVMIVDLLRNDLGRVCRYGTIDVPELFTIQEHPTLFHLVSKVRGTLRDDVKMSDLVRATFPCGSITGAPKIRAMEIIDEIETAPRALSMGAIGYLSFDGSLDLNVAIRTMVIKERIARFNVGGGIVADSRAALEYEESLTKARALLRALDADLIMQD